MRSRNPGICSFVLLGVFVYVNSYARGTPPAVKRGRVDVGKIISVVISENADEAVDIDGLTAEFRTELEHAKNQKQMNQFQHGVNTLRKVLPEFTYEERRRTLPLLQRVLDVRLEDGTMPAANQKYYVPNSRKSFVVASAGGESDSQRLQTSEMGSATGRKYGDSRDGVMRQMDPCVPDTHEICETRPPVPISDCIAVTTPEEQYTRPPGAVDDCAKVRRTNTQNRVQRPSKDVEQDLNDLQLFQVLNVPLYKFDADNGEAGVHTDDPVERRKRNAMSYSACKKTRDTFKRAIYEENVEDSFDDDLFKEKQPSPENPPVHEEFSGNRFFRQLIHLFDELRAKPDTTVPVKVRMGNVNSNKGNRNKDYDSLAESSTPEKSEENLTSELRKFFRYIAEKNTDVDRPISHAKETSSKSKPNGRQVSTGDDQNFMGIPSKLYHSENRERDAKGGVSRMETVFNNMSPEREIVQYKYSHGKMLLYRRKIFPKRKTGTPSLAAPRNSLTIIYNVQNGEKEKAGESRSEYSIPQEESSERRNNRAKHDPHNNYEVKISVLNFDNSNRNHSHTPTSPTCDCFVALKPNMEVSNVETYPEDGARGKTDYFDDENAKPHIYDIGFRNSGETRKSLVTSKTDSTKSIKKLAQPRRILQKCLKKLLDITSEGKAENASNPKSFVKLRKLIRIPMKKIVGDDSQPKDHEGGDKLFQQPKFQILVSTPLRTGGQPIDDVPFYGTINNTSRVGIIFDSSSAVTEDKRMRNITTPTTLSNDTSVTIEKPLYITGPHVDVFNYSRLGILDLVSTSPPQLNKLSTVVASVPMRSDKNETKVAEEGETVVATSSLLAQQLITSSLPTVEKHLNVSMSAMRLFQPQAKGITDPVGSSPSQSSDSSTSRNAEVNPRENHSPDASRFESTSLPTRKTSTGPLIGDLKLFNHSSTQDNSNSASQSLRNSTVPGGFVLFGANVKYVSTENMAKYIVKNVPYVPEESKLPKTPQPLSYIDVKQNLVRRAQVSKGQGNFTSQNNQSTLEQSTVSVNAGRSNASLGDSQPGINSSAPVNVYESQPRSIPESVLNKSITESGGIHENSHTPSSLVSNTRRSEDRNDTATAVPASVTGNPTWIGNRSWPEALDQSNKTDFGVIEESKQKTIDRNEMLSDLRRNAPSPSPFGEHPSRSSAPNATDQDSLWEWENPPQLPEDSNGTVANLRSNVFPFPVIIREEEKAMKSPSDVKEVLNSAGTNMDDLSRTLSNLGRKMFPSPMPREEFDLAKSSTTMPEVTVTNLHASTTNGLIPVIVTGSTSRSDAMPEQTLANVKTDVSSTKASISKRESSDDVAGKRVRSAWGTYSIPRVEKIGGPARGSLEPSEPKEDRDEEMWNFGQSKNLSRALRAEAIDFIPDESEERLTDLRIPSTKTLKLVPSKSKDRDRSLLRSN